MNNRALLYTLAAIGISLLPHVLRGKLEIVGMAIGLLSPLPVAFIILVAGTGCGVTVVVATAAGLLLLNAGNPIAPFVYLLQYGIGGLVLGTLLRRLWRWDRAVLAAVLASTLCAALVLAIVAFNRGVGPMTLVDGYVAQEVAMITSAYESADLPQNQRSEDVAFVEDVGEVLRLIFPGLTIAVAGCILMLNLGGLNLLSAGRFTLVGPPFDQWKAPDQAIWILIAAGFGSFFATGGVQTLALNVLTVIVPLYFLQGLAIVRHFFRRRNVPGFIQGASYVLIMFLSPLPLIVIGVGVFDLWADFRKPRIKKSNE